VVLSFFRGAWCSFCNLELRALQRRLPQIEALGATLLALSPESAEHSAKVAERHHLGYDILIDTDNSVARSYGLVASAAKFLTGFNEDTAIDPAEWNDNNAADLPIPATYVVGTNGAVAAAHVVGDWTRRMDPDEIIAVVREL
jgi:peroxiredoxin